MTVIASCSSQCSTCIHCNTNTCILARMLLDICRYLKTLIWLIYSSRSDHSQRDSEAKQARISNVPVSTAGSFNPHISVWTDVCKVHLSLILPEAKLKTRRGKYISYTRTCKRPLHNALKELERKTASKRR